MTGLDTYERKLLDGWEEVFKRGQLTFWVLLSLKDGPKHMAQVRTWIDAITGGAVRVEERSLYRSLQRFHDSELVTSASAASERGPDLKLYSLTRVGEHVLQAFIDRNIRLFLVPEVMQLLDGQA